MKLEVGQKIGIYELIDNSCCPRPIGYTALGYIQKSVDYPVSILKQNSNCFYVLLHSEVRKVASLIVKRLK